MSPTFRQSVLAQLLERIRVRHRADGVRADPRRQPLQEFPIALARAFGVGQPSLCDLGPRNGTTVSELVPAPESVFEGFLELSRLCFIRCSRALASSAANADPPERAPGAFVERHRSLSH